VWPGWLWLGCGRPGCGPLGPDVATLRAWSDCGPLGRTVARSAGPWPARPGCGHAWPDCGPVGRRGGALFRHMAARSMCSVSPRSAGRVRALGRPATTRFVRLHQAAEREPARNPEVGAAHPRLTGSAERGVACPRLRSDSSAGDGKPRRVIAEALATAGHRRGAHRAPPRLWPRRSPRAHMACRPHVREPSGDAHARQLTFAATLNA
jgi:hypothetical protein